MPPLVVAFAAWAGVSVAAAYLVVATVVVSAGMAVYGSAQARRAERKARDDLNASMKDRMVTRIATESPHRYIYGRAKVGAEIVAMFTTGDRDQFKHLVCVHAAHECDAIEEVYVNNMPVGVMDLDGDPTGGRFANDPYVEVAEETHTGPTFTLEQYPRAGSVRAFAGEGAAMVSITVSSVSQRSVTVSHTGPVTVAYEYNVPRKFDTTYDSGTLVHLNPTVRVRKHLGGANDPADEYLRTVVPDKWPATAVLRGLCYTVITLDLTQPEFQGGLVPIHAVIRGRKLYDPRTGLTAWSQNPALAIRDYLTSPLCAVPATDLPSAQFIAAANVCDEDIAGLGKRYTINGTVTSDQSQASVLEAMTQAMAGSLVSTTWDIYAGKYIAPVAALTQEDIVGGLSVTPGVSDASVYNGVKGQYIGPENNYVQTDFYPYQNSTYREADGRDLYTNLDFPFTEHIQRVTNLARIFTEGQRNGFTIRAEFSLKAWPRKVGERITFTSPTLGQSAKVYLITDKSYSPNSAVQLTLKEDAAEIWDFADAIVVDSTPNSDLPDPWKIDPLTAITCTSGEATLLKQSDGSTVPRILVSWPATAQPAGVQVEIEYRAISSPTWNKVSTAATETSAYLSPITPGFFYVVRARCYNPYINGGSYWIMTTYQVQVFTARPVAYKWATEQPASPNEAGSYAWPTGTYSAPSGWSLTQPAAPAGGNVTLWEVSPLVTDISTNGSTPYNWGVDAVAVGYSPNAAGTGPAGYSNARVFAYQRKATVPAGTPGAVDYDFTTGAITTATLANGWLKTIPASDGNPLYVTSASASAAGATDTIATGEWSGAVILTDAGNNGAPGLNNATVTLYQRSASATAPAKPTATTTYTFATGALTGLDGGWTTYIPTTGGQYLHTTFATAIAATATDTIAASEWAAVQLMYDAADLIAAKAVADASLAAVDAMRADDKLDPSEKPAENIRWNAVLGEQPTFDGQAAALSITTERTAYSTAFTALQTYINSLPGFTTIPGSAITIVGATYRTKFNDYYTAREALRSAIAAKSATTGGSADAATALGFNPQFSDWPTGQTYPTGWSANGSPVVVKDTVAIRTLPYAVNITANGGESGLQLTVNFSTVPQQLGVYLTGSFDANIAVANGGGGMPGLYFRLYTNAALSTYRDTAVPVQSNNTGGWQHIPFTVNVSAGERIYGLTVFLIASAAAMPGGAWSSGSKIVFDNLAFDFVQPTDFGNIGGTGKPAENATVGAPAGTPVAGLDATVVKDTVNTINAPFTVTLLEKVNTGGTGVRTFTHTGTIVGGKAPLTHSWALTANPDEPGLMLYAGTNSATVTIMSQSKTAGSSATGTLEYRVTDATGLTKVAANNVEARY